MTTIHGRRTGSRALRTAAAAALAVALLAPAGALAQPRDEPRRYFFVVEIEGIGAGRFREVSGLGIETEVIEFRDGGSNVVQKLPGRTKWPDLVLKRGFSRNTALYDWAITHATTGVVVRRSGSIALFAPDGTEVARWTFQNAWPVKWQGPTLDASGNEVAVETITIAHEGFLLVR